MRGGSPIPAIPEVLLVAPTPDALGVAGCVWRGGRLDTLWRENAAMHDWAGLGQAMRLLLERHPLGKETALACLAPPGVGGFLLLPAPHDPARDPAWINLQLGKALPFPPDAVQYRVRYRAGWAEIFWVPNDWIKTQRGFFADLGLRLTDLYPRAALFLDQAELAGGERVRLAERMGNGTAWYCFEHGRVRQSLWLSAGEAETSLPSDAAVCDGARAGTVDMAADVTLDRMRALWETGDEALCVDDSPWSVWKPLAGPLLAVGVLLAGLAGGLAWQNAAMNTAQGAALKESRELTPVALRFGEFERAVREEKARVAALRVLDDSPLPYDTLTRVVELLPERAWVQRMVFDGASLSVTGKGRDEPDVLQSFKDGGLDAIPAREETPTPTPTPTPNPTPVAPDTFEIRIKLPAAVAAEAQGAAS